MVIAMKKTERTFVMLKPDALQRRLAGEVIGRIERKGFRIIGLKLLKLDETKAGIHYEAHMGKPFFNDLIKFITSGPVIVMVVEGDDAIAGMRKMLGETDPKKAAVGTIRGDFGQYVTKNLVHASDSKEAAKREIGLYFDDSELVSGQASCDDAWIFG